ncbi:MAG: glycoside hydrolase [Deltaproteobacteria bacterium HGW-Deltaproteobacteria-19]|jgi:glycosyltransferase involved in cell wall biosynthesis|nr:MAG: glycoside hydrolase [Deltaproteobacteria bacterium HGW-Deltaproteobacteria-19]
MTMNVHVYPTPFRNESRILKITQSLKEAAAFDRIRIMAVWEEGLAEEEDLDETRRVVRIRRRIGEGRNGTFWKAVRTAEWSWRVRRFLREEGIDCINAHSLSVLPLCVHLKRSKGARLIYDTHELETETAGSTGIRRVLARRVERRLIREADAVIAVNESIASWYRRTYGLNRVWVVKNVPYRPDSAPKKTTMLRDACGVGENEILFLYQGAMVKDRGIRRLLDVFSRLDGSRHLVCMGFGEDVDLVRNFARKYPNIHYHPAVPPSEVFRYTCGADVGVHLIENTCLNHYYCLPNKIWEYLNAALPVVVSDLPEMARVVDGCGCGWKCGPSDDEALNLIGGITMQDVRGKRERALQARDGFGWHKEERELLDAYRTLGFIRH